MAFALVLVTVLACISYGAATCSDFPIRLPGKILETSPSDPAFASATCPSDAERQATLDMLNRDLDDLITSQIPIIQRLTSPIQCPGEGWIKIVDFNLESNSDAACPGDWKKFDVNGIPHCRLSNGELCQLASFSTNSIAYNQVCGTVKGFQIGRTTGFYSSAVANTDFILSDAYLDGVSITRDSLQEHIWSFASGTSSTLASLAPVGHMCPCTSEDIANQVNLPSYVGNNYFCDSGTDEQSNLRQFYPDNPLWDRQGCLPGNGCCERGPYFHANLTTSRCDDLEVRLCTSVQDFDRINIGVSIIELYVK